MEIFLKRAIDVIVATAFLSLTFPLLVVTALLIKLSSKGPVFYKWRILGVNLEPITSYKFRSMVANAEELETVLRNENKNEMNGVYFKMRNDHRMTRLGKYLRKFSIDEIPQLISVVKGNLSLVGPRPVRVVEKDELKENHLKRFSVKPGVTSPWVVNGKNQVKDFEDIVKIDLSYIENWSLFADLKILSKTIPVLFLGKNF